MNGTCGVCMCLTMCGGRLQGKYTDGDTSAPTWFTNTVITCIFERYEGCRMSLMSSDLHRIVLVCFAQTGEGGSIEVQVNHGQTMMYILN